MTAIIQIKNIPKDLTNDFIVFRVINGEAWYWGAYVDENRALMAAKEIDGLCVRRLK